jgi:murein L,D-transpeptidase YcbB/YkuD
MRIAQAILCAGFLVSSVGMVALLTVPATALFGCSAHGYPEALSLADQKLAAAALAKAGNEALPLLVAEYQRQGLEIVAASATEAEAHSAVAENDKRWQLIWQAHHALELAQGQWADALESGLDPTAALGAIEAAWCVLQTRWPKQVSPLPMTLLGCQGASP